MASSKPVLRVDAVEPSTPVVPSPPRVDVYRNLNNACLSVRNFVSGHEDYGNVIAHTDGIRLVDVSFVVQDSSQRDAKNAYEEQGDEAEGARNLHAFARGQCSTFDIVDGTPITYQPFDESMPDTFSTLDGRPVDEVDELSIWLEERDGSLGTFMEGVGLTFDDNE